MELAGHDQRSSPRGQYFRHFIHWNIQVLLHSLIRYYATLNNLPHMLHSLIYALIHAINNNKLCIVKTLENHNCEGSSEN